MQGQVSEKQYGREDEIDLVELARVLWAQRWLIGAVAVFFFLCAVTYAFLAKPVYEARISVLPPHISDIAEFNVGRGALLGLEPYSVNDVYAVFLESLTSDALRLEFLPLTGKGVIVKKGKSSGQQQVTLQHENPAEAAELLNRFVYRAADLARETQLANNTAEVSTHVQALKRRIATLRQVARQRREARIVLLEEALKVAESAGMGKVSATPGQASAGAADLVIENPPPYLLGAPLIRAELSVLRQRQSDDPFIPELRSLQEKLMLLQGISIDPDRISVFSLDSPAQVPEQPIKPKKALILGIGLVLGGMLGIFVALVKTMLIQRLSKSDMAR